MSHTNNKETNLARKLDAITFTGILIPLIVDTTVGKHGTHVESLITEYYAEYTKEFTILVS